MRYRGRTSLILILSLAGVVTAPALAAGLNDHRTPAGRAGADSLDRGLDSRSRQRDNLSRQLEQNRERLDSASEARRLDRNADDLSERLRRERRNATGAGPD